MDQWLPRISLARWLPRISLPRASFLLLLAIHWNALDADALISRKVNHLRTRRQTEALNVIELLIVIDKADNDKALARNGQNQANATQDTLRYLTGLMREVNERLEKIVFPQLLRVQLVTVIIANTTADSNATENNRNGQQVNGDAALQAFSGQANVLSPTFPHDYAILLTGYDVRRGNGSDADGRTFLGGMCSNLRQAVVEDTRVERTAWTIAKMLGHALGAEADGTGAAAACGGGYYVMSPDFRVPPATSATQPFTFSSCSTSAILTKLNSPYTQCLRTVSSPHPLNTSQYSGPELGQIYNADDQCARHYGLGSVLCRDGYGQSPLFTYDDGFCYDMRCTLANTSYCQVPGTLPFDGTTCGNQKWCQDGVCVASASAPTTLTPTCPQGDQPPAPGGVPCLGYLCPFLPPVYAGFTCCATCALSSSTTTSAQSLTSTPSSTTATSTSPSSTTATSTLPSSTSTPLSSTTATSTSPSSTTATSTLPSSTSTPLSSTTATSTSPSSTTATSTLPSSTSTPLSSTTATSTSPSSTTATSTLPSSTSTPLSSTTAISTSPSSTTATSTSPSSTSTPPSSSSTPLSSTTATSTPASAEVSVAATPGIIGRPLT